MKTRWYSHGVLDSIAIATATLAGTVFECSLGNNYPFPVIDSIVIDNVGKEATKLHIYGVK